MFFDCDKLMRVIINEGVQSIGECCFYGCNSLEYVRLPESLHNFNYAYHIFNENSLIISNNWLI